ncbi:DUF4956 domain-containing protein [Candidatus Woesearchaeota archaeon]|nr:DUF4956 domain-containing protein [Candidatus Woesearchaeota archaeon]
MQLEKYEKIFGETAKLGGNITVPETIVGLCISVILAMFIYYIYKKTYSGVLYSKNFNMTLVFTSLVVTVIMMAISGSLALSLGMVGALSIIRFRTAIKDPKDVTFLFWAITIGVANGVHLYRLSIISSLFIGALMVLFSKNIGISHPFLISLKFTKLDEQKVDAICKKYCKKYHVRNRTLSDDGGDFTVEVIVKKDNQSELLKELKKIEGVKKVMMFSHTGELSD